MLPLLVAKISSQVILNSLWVRVHTGISFYTWSRLWYLCRAFDVAGTGYIELEIAAIQAFLCCSEATVYRLLLEGKQCKAFRFYRTKNGSLQIGIGSLFKVCRSLHLKSWGTTATVLLVEILDLLGIRATATATQTQRSQQQSRYAANSKLKPDYRREFGAPLPNELLGEIIGGASHKKEAGKLPPFVLHISPSRIWVSKNFVHFGTSQRNLALTLGVSECTVKRHQRVMQMDRRQLCQKKQTYMWISTAWDNEAPEYYHDRAMLKAAGTGGDQSFKVIGYKQTGDTVRFTDGVTLGSKKQSPNKWDIPAAEFGQRFFKYGSDYWMNRCNIYRETYQLTTMRASARKYRKMLTRQGLEGNSQSSTGEPSQVDGRRVQAAIT
ncbi:hypothetical protein NIES4071_110040 (plasmid) [Calothrix sp. NIES-4071]|nr:hypothetical protein NIES4071_110040 [Calothrix sp. NIES-4071]BAZ65265.1 hypothetical protein NIES4105_109980 [Calothrix sp. NIES-4105]